MNFISHDNGLFQSWDNEPEWDGSRWQAHGEDPKAIDRRSAERILRRKAHPCECFDVKLRTSTIIYFIKKPQQ